MSKQETITEKRSMRASPKGDRLKKEIIEVALQHFSLYGFEGASIRSIAQDVGTTHSLIIYHFETKEKLWLATMDVTVGEYTDSILTLFAHDQAEPAGPILRKFIERFVRLSAQRPEIHRILTMASTQNSERIHWLLDTHLRRHFDFVSNLIRRGQLEGSVRQCDPVRLYYHIIGSAGTIFTLSREFQALTGRNVFSETEIYHTIAFIFEIVFQDDAPGS